LLTQEEAEVSMVRGTAKPISAVAVLACAWPALLLATVCLLPFLNKPFNIDDPYFLMVARQVIKQPAHPMDFSECWNAGIANGCKMVYQYTSGNPLMAEVGLGYLLVPTVLAGAHEWMAHLTQLVLAWIAILAMASLVLRLGWDRWHATTGSLLLVAIPPFLPMASTAMPDVLATALAVVGIERLAAWKAERKWSQGAMAAVAVGLVGIARPHMVLFLPLAAFFLLDNVKSKEILEQIRQKAWLWIPVIAGFALLMAVIFAIREHRADIGHLPIVVGWGHVPFNLFAYLLYLAFPLPLAVCWLANRLRMGQRRTVAALMVAALVMSAVPWFIHLGQPLVFFFVILGCGVLTSLLLEAWRKRDPINLFLLLWILIPFPVIIYNQLPIKLLLPCLPAVILLCFRLMKGLSIRLERALVVALVVASTGYSVLILHADAEFAVYGRDALHQLIVPEVARGKTVWFPGQYWSYWYAPLDGAKLTYPGGPQPKPGDLLVVDIFAMGEDAPLSRFPHRRLVQTISHKYRWGRTMGAGMGLYSNNLGYWLWGIGDSSKDRFELWRIDSYQAQRGSSF
jgi:hypothetical protein